MSISICAKRTPTNTSTLWSWQNPADQLWSQVQVSSINSQHKKQAQIAQIQIDSEFLATSFPFQFFYDFWILFGLQYHPFSTGQNHLLPNIAICHQRDKCHSWPFKFSPERDYLPSGNLTQLLKMVIYSGFSH